MTSAALLVVLATAPVRLAVLPFDNATNDPELEVLRRGMADLLMADLAGAEPLQLVDRLRLDDVRNELKLQQTKDFDPGAREKLGKLVGATHVVLGSLVSGKPKLGVLVRIVQVKDGLVVATAKVAGETEDLFELERSMVAQLLISLQLKGGKPRAGHASLPALMSWSAGVDLAESGDLEAAKSKLAEAVRLSPEFELAKERYADVLKRLREAQKKRKGSRDEVMKTLREHLAAQVAKPPLDRALGARIGLCNLALLELQALVDGKEDKSSYVEPARRIEVERLEALFVSHATALITELKAARTKSVRPQLDEADEKLSKDAFDLDVSTWDFATPTSVATDLGRFLGSGWTPYRSDVPVFAVRPTAAQRSARGLAEMKSWFDVAQKELAAEEKDAQPGHASRLANERAEALVLLGRREEAVSYWQSFLDAYPTHEDFPTYTKKLEAVMELDDEAERTEKQLNACDAALLTRAAEVATRRWRARGVTGLYALGDQLRKCGKKSSEFERAAWTVPAAELKRVADCEAFGVLKAKAAIAGFNGLDDCR